MKKNIFIFFLIISSLNVLFGDDAEVGSESVPVKAIEPIEGNKPVEDVETAVTSDDIRGVDEVASEKTDAEKNKKEDNPYSDLYTDTISIDIETSDFYELKSWCQRLNLDTEGSADILKGRLYSYYGTSKKNSSKKVANKIEIESADNLDYFTIEQIDENYAELSGNVHIKLIDEKKKENHIIIADKVIFNLKEKTLTATGNIRYQINGSSSSENFTGEKITFNIDNYDGLFNKGVTRKSIEKKDNSSSTTNDNKVFYLYGKEINKTKENAIIFDQGEITSCDNDEPHYKIKAKKIWLLTSTEWALLNGFLYIGRVPVLYFPSLIYETNKMIFNPVLGFKNDLGFFIQTSTYFLGEPKQKDDASIFNMMSNVNKDTYYKIDGLFLLKDDNPTKVSKAFQDYGSDKNYIKLLLDYYTNYGFYTAFDMSLSKATDKKTDDLLADFIFYVLSKMDSLQLYASLAKTRKIEQNEGNATTLFINDENVYASIWEDSFFWDIELPFRYGFFFKDKMNFDFLKLQFDFEIYSDPQYTADFSDRSENMDLFSILDNITSDSDDTDTSSEKSSYNWTLNLDFSPKLEVLSPYIKTMNIKTNANLYWKSKAIEDDSGDYENFVKYFFYPDKNIFPSISNVSISGQLLPITINTKKVDDDEEDKEESDKKDSYELIAPWEENESKKSVEKEDENLGEPKKYENITISNYWTFDNFFKNTLTYKISPAYSDITQYRDDDWLLPKDINFNDIEYSFKSADVNADVAYSAHIFDKFFTLQNTIDFDYNYKEHYNMNDLSEDVITTYEIEDDKGTDFFIKNSLQMSTNPFTAINYLDNLMIKYELVSILYSNDYSTEDEAFIENKLVFDEDTITKHMITLTMPLTYGQQQHTLNLSSTLEPTDFAAKGAYNFKYWITETDISTGVKKNDEEEVDDNTDEIIDEDEFEFEPLTIKEKLTFVENNYLQNTFVYDYKLLEIETNTLIGKLNLFDSLISLDGNFKYDFQEDQTENLNFNLKFWKLYANITAQTTYDYSYIEGEGWKQAEEESFIPTKTNFGIDLDIKNLKLWKNRIVLSLLLNTKIDLDLIKFNQSAFNTTFGFGMKIYKFLDLSIKIISSNSVIYRYFPGFCDEVGLNSINMFEDLFKSFNFFNEEDRYESNFNLSTIGISLKHDLHDWDLLIDYNGKPKLDETEELPKYIWESKLSISMKWKAIPEIKSEIEIEDEEITYK